MGVLRILLALSVVTAHCGGLFGKITFVGGEVAVQSFFIISGFYMSLVLDKKYNAHDSFKNYRLFISNRLLRLYPIYWVVLLLTIFIYIFGNTSKISDFKLLNFTSLLYTIFTNIFIFFQDTIMFLGFDQQNGSLFFTSNFRNTNHPLYNFLFIPQGWSLGIELIFYLIVPFLINKKTNFILVLIFITILIRIIIYNYFKLNIDPWTYRFFPTELLFFLLGIISHRHRNVISKVSINPVILLLTNVVVAIVYAKLPSYDIPFFHLNLKSLFYFALIFISLPLLFNYTKDSIIDRQIGELSYPIYISHILIFIVTRSPIFNEFNSGTYIIIYSILFSIILVKYISNPIEKFRQTRVKNSIV